MNELDNNYILYAHLPNDSNWNIESYKIIKKIATLEELISIVEFLSEDLIKNCMFFIMKDSILPLWEDEENKAGGSISYKINNTQVYSIWKTTIYYFITNNILENKDIINGISISPKKNFCILKIWLKSCDNITASVVNKSIGLSEKDALIKSHI